MGGKAETSQNGYLYKVDGRIGDGGIVGFLASKPFHTVFL